MGVQNFDDEQFELTSFYAFGSRYKRELETLTASQQIVAIEHAGYVGTELIRYIVAELDYVRLGRARPRALGSPLERLVKGYIDAAVVIGERTSLEVVRRMGLVVIDGVTWHTVH